ncbi:hypothetical protein [Agromyces humi]|uniref:hypothetical protein n=1 Tax=Agromyces humi TaxID=1766800 RepID=UPI001359831A|nr:hypothetical protein [Agromyces humi]
MGYMSIIAAPAPRYATKSFIQPPAAEVEERLRSITGRVFDDHTIEDFPFVPLEDQFGWDVSAWTAGQRLHASEQVIDAIIEWCRIDAGRWRDVATLQIDDKPYYVTGGMSGGEYPTESFAYVEALSTLEAFDEPFTKPDGIL